MFALSGIFTTPSIGIRSLLTAKELKTLKDFCFYKNPYMPIIA